MRFSFSLLCLLLCLLPLGALEQVGQLANFSGDVLLDAFGKDLFIKPIIKDSLYNSSVIKTGKNGSATIIIYSHEVQVPPNSVIRLADIMRADNLKAALGSNVFSQLENYIKNILFTSFFQVEKSAKCTVETTAGEEADDSFISATETDKRLLAMVKKAMLAENFAGAIPLLISIDNPVYAGLQPGEQELLIALCYFFLCDYGQAAGFFTKAGKQLPGGETADRADRTAALFNLSAGTTFYLTDSGEAAAASLRQFLQLEKETGLKPYAYHILCHSLLRTGRKSEAKSCLQAALKHYTTDPLQKEWSRLLTGL